MIFEFELFSIFLFFIINQVGCQQYHDDLGKHVLGFPTKFDFCSIMKQLIHSYIN